MDAPPQSNLPCPHAATGRRSFLRMMTAILGAVAAFVLGLPVIGYFFSRRTGDASWVDLGPLHAFPINETRRIDFSNPMAQSWDGVTAFSGVFARREEDNDEGQPQFLVLSIHCAHLGCPVTWFQQSGLFMCPCHGGVYYADGSRASGPPPRGMFHCRWEVKDERLFVQAPHYPTLDNTLDGPLDRSPLPTPPETDVHSV